MTIILNGSTGITTPADTVTGNETVGGTLAVTGATMLSTITSPTATALTIQSAGTTAMTIDTSQNVGIGTTSPTAKLHVADGGGNMANFISSFNGGGNIQLSCTNVSTTVTGYVGANAFTTNVWSLGSSTSTPVLFYTNATERMRLDTSGRLIVGATASLENAMIQAQSTTADLFTGYNSSTQKFAVSNTGQIYAVFTSISALSDITQKENVQNIPYGLSTVLGLKPKQFDFKAEMGGEKGLLGFIAQDVEAVIPELVKPNADGLKTLKMGDILPVLVAAIQELSAKNDALEDRLAALEAK